ncbi:extracellular catalytic domain type 2 short-chain-length polyhydroxyalkanoate depolymerase [Rhodanobacter ginsengiterrae]|uniref:extracellular catalytic domain type 2 short-chain-length polyhydroxyalkanoate depolymerase n=1 Tax=Rhodanobacter ginsengiterrae TaxID=2008451 RepID=UPI003CEAD5E6
MSDKWIRRVLCAVLAAGVGLATAKDAGAPLPGLKIDRARVAVVGLSSGAYMASQAQLAYPELFPNAALVAGGPFGCAGGKLDVALGSCMKGVPAPDVAALVASAEKRSAAGDIGALKDLAHAHVYLLHGGADALVAPAVAEAGAHFYEQLRDGASGLQGMQVHDDGQRAFAHNLPVIAAGDDCDKSVAPYLGHCGFDAAGEIFTQMFGKPAHAATAARGELRRFDQDALRPDGVDAFMAKTGYVYLPPTCLAGKPCGVVVAFHGCKQNAEAVGESFVKDAGFNRWADVYDVAVLYPQTRASFAPLNPQACWDWWGYSGANYDSRQGVQLRWLVNAVRALGLPPTH